MAYGRLDVFWPNGRFESFMLEDDTISVGRAEGNTIRLESNTVSRYHFSITHQNDTVTLADMESENGTFVDGVQITGPFVLDGVAEIQVGHLRIIFQPTDDAPTMPIHIAGEDTQRIEREESSFRLDVDMLTLHVWPASSASTELSITHTGDETTHYSVNVIGVPDDWVRINRTELNITSGETAYVLIHIRPPRRPDILPTTHHAAIQVIPEDKPETMLEAPLEVVVHGYAGFGMALARHRIAPDGEVRLFLHNQGNEPLTLMLTGASADANTALKFRLPEKPIVLAGGQRMQLAAQVQPVKRPLVGQPVEQAFDIRVKAHNAAGFLAVTRGKLQVMPVMQTWMALTAGGIAVSILALLLLALTGVLSPPPDPVIEAMTVNGEQLAQGDDIIVQWQAQNTASFQILVNQILQDELAGDVRQYTIPSDNLQGIVNIELVAQNNGNFANYAVVTYIYRPMAVETFRVEPQQIVRNVVETVTVVWNVPGSIETRISGLNDFTNAPLQTQVEPSGAYEVSGIPTQPITLVLRAEDEIGNILEETQTIALIEPECTALTDVPLREGPNQAHQTVSTVPAGVTVVVDAQDVGSGWLRMALPGQVQGWGERDSFQCAATFNVANLRKVQGPPLPATATPMVTPTLPDPTATLVPPTGTPATE